MTIFYVETAASNINANLDNSGCTLGAALNGSGASASGDMVTLPGLSDVSSIVVTPGDTQSTVYLSQAGNAQRKIFKIIAKFPTTASIDIVQVDVTPTSVTSSTWRIGGPIVWPGTNVVYHSEDMLLPGDVLEFQNTPTTRTATYISQRRSGDHVTGQITIRGKAGVRPVLEMTSTTGNVLTGQAFTNWVVENLEIVHSGGGTPGHGWSGTISSGVKFINVKFSNGNAGIANSAVNAIRCEFSGLDSLAAFPNTSPACSIFGCYIHDCDGYYNATANAYCTIGFTIFDTIENRCIQHASAASTGGSLYLYNNVFYNSVLSGIEVADVSNTVLMVNCILSECGGAGDYNLEWTGTVEVSGGVHHNNIFHKSSGPNYIGITLNSTELTSNPLFTDPGNGIFTLQDTSPAKGTGFPGQFLGGSLGYMDIGALQRQEPAGGAGGGSRSRIQTGH